MLQHNEHGVKIKIIFTSVIYGNQEGFSYVPYFHGRMTRELQWPKKALSEMQPNYGTMPLVQSKMQEHFTVQKMRLKSFAKLLWSNATKNEPLNTMTE